MEKKNFNGVNTGLATEFIKNCFTEFSGKSDFQEKVLVIKNGLVLRVTWDGEALETELYDQHRHIMCGDALEESHLTLTCKGIEEDIQDWYTAYIQECIANKDDISLPDSPVLHYDRRKKTYYTQKYGQPKVEHDPFEFAYYRSQTTNRFWY